MSEISLIRNPQRAFEDVPVSEIALGAIGLDFIADYRAMTAWLVDNCQHEENKRLRFGMPIEPYAIDPDEMTDRAELLAHAEAMLGENIGAWQWVYDTLSDTDSKAMMMTVLAYRALGWRYVHMPMDTPAFWDCMGVLGRMEGTVPPEKTLITQPMQFRLAELDLTRLGHDVRVYTDAFGMFNEFVYPQYVYRGRNALIGPGPGDVAIDCGACFGGTSMFLASQVGPTGKVFSFEFFADNLTVYEKNRALNPALAERVTLVPAPVWSSSDQIMSIEGAGPATQVHMADIEGAEKVSTVAIDDLVAREGLERVDFIKMDIEGAEMEALRGAAGTIAKHHPTMAVCVYHKLIDFIEIPLMLKETWPGYEIYFQHSTVHGDETVVFAVDPARFEHVRPPANGAG